jgi:transposase
VATSDDPKIQALRERYALNLHPQKVTDPLFLEAQAFGFSRPVFYQALAAFEQAGLPGLVPRRPGPKGAHKLTDEILEYIEQQQALDQALRAGTLAERVLEQFGLSVHPRSIERALKRRRTRE